MFLKRYLIVIPPLTQPLVGDEVASYLPSMIEIAVTVGAASGMILLLIGLFRVFPVLGIHEITSLEGSRVGHVETPERGTT